MAEPSPRIVHESLGCTLKGVLVAPSVAQYRGIQYATYPADQRLSPPQLLPKDGPPPPGNHEKDCTEHGRRCPQIAFDLTALFRVPGPWSAPDVLDFDASHREAHCLNLHITTPCPPPPPSTRLPVLLWLHGGSLIATVGSAATHTADPTHLVAQSVAARSPIIVVAPNYRLGLFGFSHTGAGERANLGLQDQLAAVEWVQRHIGGFGGDPARVTLAGESAGAVSAHAHCVVAASRGTPAGFHQLALMSGSLYAVPPQPPAAAHALTLRVAEHLGYSPREQREDPDSLARFLERVSAADLVRAQQELAVAGAWFTDDGSGRFVFPPRVSGEGRAAIDGVDSAAHPLPHRVRAVMVGDCGWEGSLWNRAFLQLRGSREVCALFPASPAADRIRQAYGITADGAVEQVRSRALEFVADAKFSYHAEVLARRWTAQGIRVFRYVLDQPNPNDRAVGPHHAVDILFLFGEEGFGGDVGREVRGRWIEFVNGRDPWAAWDGEVNAKVAMANAEMAEMGRGKVMAFGPGGTARVLESVQGRRRTEQWRVLRELGWENVQPVVAEVVRGKVSFDPGI